MRAAVFVLVCGFGLAAASNAYAIGCLSGGAAGALGGHMMGHGVLGAVGGCIAGHEWHKHQQRMRQQDFENQSAYDSRRRQLDQDYRSPWNQ
jgi:outer membrane lipoprotein SlyB